MEAELATTGGAAAIALIHTLAGPDHYVPFIAMGRAQRWSVGKLVWITVLCGIAHVGSSLALGALAAAFSAAVGTVEQVQEVAGSFAGYSLVVFGGVYGVWGIYRAIRGNVHRHVHVHEDGTLHRHVHAHHQGHQDATHHGGTHEAAAVSEPPAVRSITPWALFLIFAFGPCEPLIAFAFPVGLAGDWALLAWISLVFGGVTLVTMVAAVLVAHYGLARLQFPFLARTVHFWSGLAIFLSGAAIVWLGL